MNFALMMSIPDELYVGMVLVGFRTSIIQE